MANFNVSVLSPSNIIHTGSHFPFPHNFTHGPMPLIPPNQGRSINNRLFSTQQLISQSKSKTNRRLPAGTFEAVGSHNHGMFLRNEHLFPGTFQHRSQVQGPVALRNGTSGPTVVNPTFAIPTLNNNTLMQLPVLWTALSLALGVEVHGEIIRGLPCIKRLNQLFCRIPGPSYPFDKIERFIDQHKALMRRMYGEFLSDLGLGEIIQSSRSTRAGRSVQFSALKYENVTFRDYSDDNEMSNSGYSKIRNARQANPGPTSSSDRIDACDSKMEIVTPYWATNSAGHNRAIVNTNDFSQVIHQEVCTKQSTKRCNGDCGCEQKFRWHRMLAYDAEDDCKGIFMDWFMFPSCCVCRCDPL